MKQIILLLLSVFFIQTSIFSIDFEKIEKHVKNTPTSVTKSMQELSKYLVKPFKNENEKFAAIYFWVAKNITYAVELKNAGIKYRNNNELLNYVLKNKRGVCQHYSELFTELSRLAGLESYVIDGYGKEFGKVMKLAHAWNAIRIKKEWYFIDATWGAGYLHNNKFKQEFDLKYFMVKPDVSIKDHIAFDPMWQLLEKPLKYEEFNTGKLNNKSKKKFNFNDTIKNHLALNLKQQVRNEIRRVSNNGVKNRLVQNKLLESKAYLSYLMQKTEINKINDAVKYFNSGIDKFNSFSKLLNKKNKGQNVSYSQLINLLTSSEKDVKKSKEIYLKVNSDNKNVMKAKKQALKDIGGVLITIKKQKESIKRYK